MNSTFVRRIAYPTHERFKGQETVRAFQQAMARNSWTPEQLQAFQFHAIQRLINAAVTGSSYYRASLKGNDPVAEMRSLPDVQKLPFLTKDIIRSRATDLITVPEGERKNLVPFSTGGSTGEPIRFFVDRQRIASEWAACWRARTWWGLDWGDPWVWLWGSPIELSTGDKWKA